MPIKCKKGKPRYRYRKIKKGKQRLAFCDNKVVEVKTFKNKTKKTKIFAGEAFGVKIFNEFKISNK